MIVHEHEDTFKKNSDIMNMTMKTLAISTALLCSPLHHCTFSLCSMWLIAPL